MLLERNGTAPRIDPAAKIADSACIVGNVSVGAGSYIDHHVVIESAGPEIRIAEGVVVLATSVIRSVGGSSRPACDVSIGARTLVAPHCVVTGSSIGHHCYLATSVIVLQGARIGDYTRLGVGAIVHANTVMPDRTRIGMRHVAVPSGDSFITTADVESARRAVRDAGFFEAAFGLHESDADDLHEQVIRRLLDEVHGWNDGPV